MIGLAVFAAALIGAGSDIKEYALSVVLGFLVAFLFGIAGNAINDYLDRETDRINHPERPIPSGKLKPGQALLFSFVFFSISFLLALYLSFISNSPLVVAIVIIALASQLAYEKKFKHEKIVGNIIIGTQTALAFVFGGAVVGRTLITGIIAVAVFLSIVGREIIKDIEDVKGDKDRISLPMKLGVRNAGIVASLLIILAVSISPLPYTLHQFGWEYLLVVSIADIMFIGSLPLIFKDAKLARRMLKFAMLVAIIAFIIGSISINQNS